MKCGPSFKKAGMLYKTLISKSFLKFNSKSTRTIYLMSFILNYFSKYSLNFMPPTPSNKLGQGQQRTGKVVKGLLEHSTVIEVL